MVSNRLLRLFSGVPTTPHVPLRIDPSQYRPGITKLLSEIRPHWKDDEIRFKQFKGGLTNSLVGVSAKNDSIILVRIYGSNTGKFINRTSEITNLVLLNKYLGNPAVHAQFDNGLCYGYVKGRPLDLNELYDERIARLNAKQMAKMHLIPLPVEDTKEPLLSKVFFGSWFDEVPEALETEAKTTRLRKLIGSIDQLKLECHELLTQLVKLHSPVVFCHNDMQCRNLIFNQEKDSITFVDLEYGGPNYRGFDLGDYFCEFSGVEAVDYNLYPKRNHQLFFLRMYLEESFILKGENPNSVTSEMVEELYIEANQFALACHLAWGIWCLIQARYSQLDFDYLEYAGNRFDEFHARKEVFLAL